VVDAGTRAGFAVEPVEAADPAGTLRTRPEDWDVAIVPVAQEELPVAALAARWRSGGATNVTGHADAGLDALLDALVAQTDPAAVPSQVTAVSDALVATGAVLPIVRTPALTVTAARSADAGLPVLDPVPALTPGAADLTWWWDWTRR
jgi:peptide/nickel transport system substrate-binding protein